MSNCLKGYLKKGSSDFRDAFFNLKENDEHAIQQPKKEKKEKEIEQEEINDMKIFNIFLK